MASFIGHAYLLAPATIMTNDEAIPRPTAIAGLARASGFSLVLDTPVRTNVEPAKAMNSPDLARARVEPSAEDAELWMGRRLLGLSVVLRLALTAQAAGATAVVLPSNGAGAAMKSALADSRLKIPVSEANDPTIGDMLARAPAIRVPANLVVHRAAFGALAKRLRESAPGGEATRDGTWEAAFDPESSDASADWRTASATAGPYGFEPIAVHDRASFRVAERALLRSLRKPQDGWTSTHLNRPVSLAITRRLVATSLRPNQVSVAILGVGLLGAFLASRGTYAMLVAGAALFHTQSVLDGCDGEMSRLTFRGSHTGEWLDTVGDDLTNYGFFGGAAYGLYTQTGQTLYLALGGLTVFCGLVGSGLEYRYLVKIGSGDLLKYPLGIGKAPGPQGKPAVPKSAVSKALDAVAPLFKRDTFVFLTLLGAVAGAVGPLLAIFAAGAVGVLVAVIRAELRMARERATPAGLSPSSVDPAAPRD
jgi:1L-myo-inositol 1-phosphate cytidylyltransferase / CDP-L-myo-inositol myo-inositolphosphotransferase